MQIPSSTLVLVADGRRALILRNRGDAKFPNLQLETTIESERNPSSHEQGNDRPERVHSNSSVGTRRSAVETTDLHERSEVEFAGRVAAAVAERQLESSGDPLIIVAPPRFLAKLRQDIPKAVSKSILAELDKDLTKHSVIEIEALLAAT